MPSNVPLANSGADKHSTLPATSENTSSGQLGV
jgi:hypothetical protein